MNKKVLVDSSYLVALYNPNDKHHQRAVRFLLLNRYDQIIPAVVTLYSG